MSSLEERRGRTDSGRSWTTVQLQQRLGPSSQELWSYCPMWAFLLLQCSEALPLGRWCGFGRAAFLQLKAIPREQLIWGLSATTSPAAEGLEPARIWAAQPSTLYRSSITGKFVRTSQPPQTMPMHPQARKPLGWRVWRGFWPLQRTLRLTCFSFYRMPLENGWFSFQGRKCKISFALKFLGHPWSWFVVEIKM